MEGSQFHITIGSSPIPELTLENDLRMIKSALLYADKIKLCSFMTSILLMMAVFRDMNSKQQWEFIYSVAPTIYEHDRQKAANIQAVLTMYKYLGKKRNLSKQELLVRMNLHSKLKTCWNDIRQHINEILLNAKAEDLLSLIETNLVELHIIGEKSGFADQDTLTKEFTEVLSETISNTSTYPLFDDEMGNFVRLGLKEGALTASPSDISRGKHSALASNILKRLPLFDEAPIDELLDIRKELEKPLVRFRSAMIKFSESIKNAAWDEEFSFDAEQVFQKDVAPAILDIEQSVKSNNYLSSLTRKLVDKPLVLASGSGLSLLMSQFSELPQIITQVLPVGVASAAVVFDAYKEWQQKHEKIEQNCLFFYYRAGKLLNK